MKRCRALISFAASSNGTKVVASAGEELFLERGLALDLELLSFIEPIQEVEKARSI